MSRESRQKFIEDAVEGNRRDLAPKILSMMGDRSPWVRLRAMEALVEWGVPEGRLAVQIGLGDSSFVVRDDAVEYMAQVGKRGDLHRLLMAIKDSNWAVRCSACYALSVLGGKEAFRAVRRALFEDSHKIVRAWAADAIEAFPDGRSALEDALEQGQKRIPELEFLLL